MDGAYTHRHTLSLSLTLAWHGMASASFLHGESWGILLLYTPPVLVACSCYIYYHYSPVLRPVLCKALLDSGHAAPKQLVAISFYHMPNKTAVGFGTWAESLMSVYVMDGRGE